MQKTDRISFFKKILFQVWLGLCIGVFVFYPSRISYLYWVNFRDWRYFPEWLARLDWSRYLLEFLDAIGGVILFCVACISLGIFVARVFKINHHPNPSTPLSDLALFCTDFILGGGLFSIVFLIVAGINRLTPFWGALILLAGFLLGLRDLIRVISTVFGKNAVRPTPENNIKIILWISLAILLLSIFQSTARLSYDGNAIYFSDAKLTALSGRVAYFTDDTFVASVFQPAILYTAIIQLFGDQAARMLSWLCGVTIILISLALGEKIGLSKQARIILLAFMLTSTAFLDLMGDGKVDLISAAPVVASIYWAVGSDNQTPKSRFLLIGFLAGYASVARPFNVFLLGIFLFLFYVQQAFLTDAIKNKIKFFLLSLTWIGLGAIGWGVYYLFTNWMISGAPLAFLSSIAAINPASGPWDAAPNQILSLRLLYPFVVTFRNSPQSLGNITPLFIGFLPTIFDHAIRINAKITKELLSATLISGITLLLWIGFFFTIVEIRYVLFLWIILFMPVAELTATALQTEDKNLQKLEYLIIAALLGFVCLRTVYISIASYSPLDKHGNPQCFDFPLCQSLTPVNQSASAGERVLTLSAYRYYLRTDLFACSTTHEEYNLFQRLTESDANSFWKEIYRRGYKYIVVDNDYAIRHLRLGLIPNPSNAPNWIKLTPLYEYSGGKVAAYKIDAITMPISVEYRCSKNISGVWEVGKVP
jgi:hypothetical protein